MKTMKYFLSMAALALVGAMTVSCSSDDNIIDQPQQPETKNNVVTLTTTVGLDGGAGTTRALTSTGVKTFAVGETMVLRYKNTKDDWVKAVSNALEVGDIADGSKSATFTFTLTNPDKTKNVDYIYPAAIVDPSGNMNEYALFNNQDGTLAKLASTFDYSRKIGTWDGENLPSLTLENQLAILAITLKDEAGENDITSSITGLTLSDGTKTYNVTREAVAGPIYVAIFPTEDATITVTATDGTKNYTKPLTGKTYAKGNGYPVKWRMAEPTNLKDISSNYQVKNGEVLTGTLGSNVKISIADGATVMLKDVNINGSGTWTSDDWAGITCEGDATIILEGTNTVKGFYEDYPGIQVPVDKTLTIQGTGTLNASSNGYGSGIGGGYDISCGNIVIKGGTINANGGGGCSGIGMGTGDLTCGTITISGGDITANGGTNGAGIGIGSGGLGASSCGAITISGGTVKATGGNGGAGIGSGHCGGTGTSSCGTITISGGTVEATGGSNAAGIGSGYNEGAGASCGTITITSGVKSVTATKGSGAPNSIGAGKGSSEITVKIEAGADVTQN